MYTSDATNKKDHFLWSFFWFSLEKRVWRHEESGFNRRKKADGKTPVLYHKIFQGQRRLKAKAKSQHEDQ